MGLFDFFKSSDNKRPSIELSDFKFLSDDHTRIENGRPTTANNKGAWRGIRVKTSDNQTFYATMYNMNENHPVWGDNIQMAEKRMKVIEETNDKIILRGFGSDAMGASFADYGLTLHKSNNNVTKVTLHMHDRNIDIVYQKSEESNTIKEKNDKEKNINVTKEIQGNGAFSFNNETWEFLKKINNGKFVESEQAYTVKLTNGINLSFPKNSEIIAAKMYNQHLSTDLNLFEVCELLDSENGNFLLYRAKKEDIKDTFIVASIGGFMAGSSIWFKIE